MGSARGNPSFIDIDIQLIRHCDGRLIGFVSGELHIHLLVGTYNAVIFTHF
jgi:hypothetical protein